MDFQRGTETDSGRQEGFGHMVSLKSYKKKKQSELGFVKGKLPWVFTLNSGHLEELPRTKSSPTHESKTQDPHSASLYILSTSRQGKGETLRVVAMPAIR